VLARAHAVAVPSAAHLTVSAELPAVAQKVRVVPFGVDAERFIPGEPVQRPAAFAALQGAPTGLFVGRLVGYKGLDVLLEAIRGTDLRVVVVGSGPLARVLAEDVRRLDLGRQVLLAGEVGDVELPAYYQAADYLVLPSTSTAEMFGIVLLEAMASARPVITTALPTGVREVNQRDVTGLEVPPGDPVALRQAMRRLADDPDLRRQLGSAGRRRVEERFTLRLMVQHHLALYDELASKVGQGGTTATTTPSR